MPTSRSGENWSWEEHLLAFNLYNQISFGTIHMRNPRIIELASILSRSVGSVSYKLANFARLDPVLQKRDIRGMPHGAKGEEQVWLEFQKDPEGIAFESERLLALRSHESIEAAADLDVSDLISVKGKDREAIVKIRVNQNFFRKRILSAYNFRCCVTGMSASSMLVASHIIPWASDATNRLNPRNGLCLNALHDRAFDRGLMWISPDFKISFSKHLKKTGITNLEWLLGFEGAPLILPKDFCPDPKFLASHSKACKIKEAK